jgi:hypothetical protein
MKLVSCVLCVGQPLFICVKLLTIAILFKRKKPKIFAKQNMTFDVKKNIPPYTSHVIFVVFLGCNLKKKIPM